jgi:hypothetical protein
MSVVRTEYSEVVTYIRMMSFLYISDFHTFCWWFIVVWFLIHNSSFMLLPLPILCWLFYRSCNGCLQPRHHLLHYPMLVGYRMERCFLDNISIPTLLTKIFPSHSCTASLSHCLCLTWNYSPSVNKSSIVVATDTALEQPVISNGLEYLGNSLV